MNRNVVMWGGLCAACLLSGCAVSTSPATDARFGQAVRALNAQQTLNPDAARQNEGRTSGGDGRLVRGAMDRATESYRNPPAPESLGPGISVGTGVSSR